MVALLATLTACGSSPEAQGQKPAASAAAAKLAFDGGRAYEHLRQVVSFGPRPAGSPAIERTRPYILAQLKALGLPVLQQPFDAQTPVGGFTW